MTGSGCWENLIIGGWRLGGNRRSELGARSDAGLNSTPALVGIVVPLALYIMCALNVSYTRKAVSEDKQGKVTRMRKLTIAYCGRNVAAPIAAACSGVIGHIASGGSG